MFLRNEDEGTRFAGKIDITVSDLLDFLRFKDEHREKWIRKSCPHLYLNDLNLKRRLDCVQQLFARSVTDSKESNRFIYFKDYELLYSDKKTTTQQYSHLRKSPTMERNNALEINREISKKIGKRSSGISSTTSFSPVRRGDKLLLRLVLCKCSRKKVN